jgi:hypothetical protein
VKKPPEEPPAPLEQPEPSAGLFPEQFGQPDVPGIVLGDGARELAGPLGVFCGSGDLGVGEVAD